MVAAHPARTMEEFRGLGRRRPLLAIALVVSLLGLVGTPPTAVFVGKLTAFAAAFDGGMAWLAVLAAVNTVASLFYYLRWIARCSGTRRPPTWAASPGPRATGRSPPRRRSRRRPFTWLE